MLYSIMIINAPLRV